MAKNIITTKIPLPSAKRLISQNLSLLSSKIMENGDELRIVGGLVRDFIFDQEKNNSLKTKSSQIDFSKIDFDLACKFPPVKTLKILEENNIKAIPTGIKYGTVTALIGDEQYQITSLRKDVKNFGRHPQVEFVDDFFEDAKRRDFTINALSIDFQGNLYDYFGGLEDLKNQKVRFIGGPSKRIEEDYLRILRFFRFSAKYARNIDEIGLESCIEHKNSLKNLSLERVRDELFKMLRCKNRDNLIKILQIMLENDILQIIFPEISPKKILGISNLFQLEEKVKVNFSPIEIIAIICDDKIPNLTLSKAEISFLNGVNKPKFTIDFEVSEKYLAKILLSNISKNINSIYIKSLVLNDNFKNFIDDFIRISRMINSIKIPPFPINGDDLIKLQIEPRNIGKLLKIAKEYWWEKDFKPNKKEITLFINEKITSH
ncbi:MAG: poly(A) polymerase [Lentimonas sp.]|jgi:poly(A) polymerase